MRTVSIVLALAFAAAFLPAAANAANVCVWNYDALDTWFDNEAGQTINSAYWVEGTLQDQGHTVTVVSDLPTSLDSYDVVFCLMGWYRC